MNIVILAPSGAVASALNQLSLTANDRVTAVTAAGTDADVATLIVKPAWRATSEWVQRMLGRSAAGRNVMRLSPFDAGRRFAGALRRDRRIRVRIGEADLLIVLERDGILAGWRAAQRWARASAPAVYGVPPAQAILAATRR